MAGGSATKWLVSGRAKGLDVSLCGACELSATTLADAWPSLKSFTAMDGTGPPTPPADTGEGLSTEDRRRMAVSLPVDSRPV